MTTQSQKIIIEGFNPIEIVEITSEFLYQNAMQNSIKDKKRDEPLDPYWEAELPEILKFLDNQIYLFLLRDYVSKEMIKIAWNKAQEISMPTVSETEDATLCVKAIGRYKVWLIDLKELQDGLEKEIPNYKEAIEVTINPEQLFYKWIYHCWQLRLMARCFNEVAARIKDNNLRRQTFSALLDLSSDDYKSLLTISRNIAFRLMPFNQRWEWEDAQKDVVSNWIMALRSKPFHEQLQKLGVTQKAIENSLTDHFRKIKRQPSSVSLDENIKTSDGRTIPIIELMVAQTEQADIEEPLTDQQWGEIEALVGEIGREIVEYRLKHPKIAGTHGEIKELYQALGYHRNTIGKYVDRIELHKTQIAQIIQG